MPKKIFKYAMTVFSLLAFAGLFPLFLWAWEDCPFGRTNDPAPGKCFRYVDTDNSGFCDHSESLPAAGKETDDDAGDKKETGGKGTAEEKKKDQEKSAIGPETAGGPEKEYRYYFLPVFIFLLAAYCGSSLFARAKVINIINQRKFWNLIMAALFIPVVLTSFIMAVGLEYTDYRIKPAYLQAITFWHAEFGFAFAIIAVFHCLWHGIYYSSIFKKKRPDIPVYRRKDEPPTNPYARTFTNSAADFVQRPEIMKKNDSGS